MLSIVIPTYGREGVLIETIEHLRGLVPRPDEIIVIDQTTHHEEATQKYLDSAVSNGWIRLLHQSPSIPMAMNRGLVEAKADIVLFVDDDIIPTPKLIEAHAAAHRSEVAVVVGQVLQPGELPLVEYAKSNRNGLEADLDFRFCSTKRCSIKNVIACNMSVNRKLAIAAGGFVENFVKVAYRFETEFARRMARVAGKVLFEPEAAIRHLAAGRGGTRSFGKHLTSARPEHSVGDYYFALQEGRKWEAFRYCCRRFLTSALTRFHLKHPWYIPPKLIGELRGLLWAMQLKRQGQKLISHHE